MSGIVGSLFNHRGSGVVAKLGTDGQSINSGGAGVKALAEDAAAGGFTLGTEQATTSGSAVPISTSIPSGTKMIVVNMKGTSLDDGWPAISIQIGDSGGYESSGYNSRTIDKAGNYVGGNDYDAFSMTNASDSGHVHDGQMILCLEDSSDFTWTALWNFATTGGVSNAWYGAGSKSLSAELDRLQMINIGGGTPDFDAGIVNILYL